MKLLRRSARTLAATLALASALAVSDANANQLPPRPDPASQARNMLKVAHRLQTGLALFARLHGSPSPMAREALEITRAARRQGRSPLALVAIAGVESTFGTAQACPSYGGGRWNTTGLGSCGHYWTRITLCGRHVDLAELRSYADGITVTGLILRCLVPGARTIWDVRGYCAGCASWNGEVASVMRRYFRSWPGLMWSDAVRAVR